MSIAKPILFLLLVCMAPAASAAASIAQTWDGVAVVFVYRGKHSAVNVAAARHQAISYAAHLILKERFALSLNASTTLAVLNAQMAALGYNTAYASKDTSAPAGVGRS